MVPGVVNLTTVFVHSLNIQVSIGFNNTGQNISFLTFS